MNFIAGMPRFTCVASTTEAAGAAGEELGAEELEEAAKEQELKKRRKERLKDGDAETIRTVRNPMHQEGRQGQFVTSRIGEINMITNPHYRNRTDPHFSDYVAPDDDPGQLKKDVMADTGVYDGRDKLKPKKERGQQGRDMAKEFAALNQKGQNGPSANSPAAASPPAAPAAAAAATPVRMHDPAEEKDPKPEVPQPEPNMVEGLEIEGMELEGGVDVEDDEEEVSWNLN